MKRHTMIAAGVSLLLYAAASHAEVKVSVGHRANADARADFKFENVPLPAKNDDAANATFSILDGQRDPNGGDLAVLHDGRVPSEDDAPRDNFFFQAGTTGGRLLVDLGAAIEIKQINTYSWHSNTRGPQVYKLYAADGKASDFNTRPGKGADPAACGWKLVANVDTRPKTGDAGGQYGVSISDSDGTLGKYQYLLFDVFRTENEDPFGNTFYSEIDVIDRNAPAPEMVDTATAQTGREIVEVDGGKYKVTIDTSDLSNASDMSDLSDWAQKELPPMIQEWYPKLIKLLPSEGFEAPQSFSITFSRSMQGVAATGGTRIRCAANWMRQNMKGEAKGAVFHEMVHVVQQYGRGRRAPDSSRPPGWLTEGITDYLRWFVYEPETHGAEITKRNLSRARYDGNYRITANFLNWVVAKQGKDFIPKLNAAIREGRYNEELWRTLTSHTVQELGAEWKADLEKKLGVEPGAPATAAPSKEAKATPATGPLRVHPSNPRYFADAGGRAVFLTGSHTWGNLQDYTYATLPSPPPLDFDAYLAFLARHRHNCFRLWAWESGWNPGAKQGTITYDPMPYERPGPGAALDGKPRFDLTRFNPAYFDRLRSRVAAARDKGIYASIMLFNGFSIEGKGNVGGDPWRGHPFHPANNVNGMDGGGSRAIHTLSNPAVTARQEAYVRKIIDSVNDLDNVLYEITNEDTGTSADLAWQTHMIQFIKRTEADKPRRHPVGMTVAYPAGNDAVLSESPADWISPAAKLSVADGRKVILNDTDHSYFWIGLRKDGPAAQRVWAWENFTRGSQCLFMDPYLDPSHDPGRNNPVGGAPDPYWDTLRDALGRTRAAAERLNLAAAVPHGELASSTFCLADPGNEYLVYLPRGGDVTVDLSAAAGELAVEWMDPVEGTATRADAIAGGGRRTLKSPFAADAVLHLRRKP